MKLGSNHISSVKIGSTDVNKIYIGSTEVWSSFTGLLDTYTGAAAAYSLRLLSTAYTGSAIRVRRASDNTEQDIGFVNNELDTSTLTSFCSGTNGFVKTWYDQSGNGRDVTQTTLANQPQIVSSGSVILDNAKPSILFDGVNDFLQKTSFSFPTTKITISTVGSRIGSSSHYSIGYTTFGGFINLNGSSAIGFNGRPSGGSYFACNTTTTGTTNQILQLNIYDGSNLKASLNAGNFTLTSVSANPIVYGNQTLQFGAITSIGQFYNGNNSEFIMWDVDQTNNKSGIESNINSYYGIY